ncbi:MAG TPA: endonuclease/exonuclease/phosphatase family protein [Polyangiaceae bacterium]|nr:endonuclease/exonuclease/phosphatase family protein [Polyangiaceae bacterium]
MTTFRVMTYNVHSCVGTDGKLDPGRIAEVIARSEADIVALQELDVCQARSDGLHQPEWLAEKLQMSVHFTAARRCDEGHYGNAILSRHPFSVLSEGGLRRRTGEQRAVQWLQVSIGGLELNVMNTHLSIHFRERLLQIEQLLGAEWIAKSRSHLPLVVCGDLNSSQFSPVYRSLRKDLVDAQRANGSRAVATWPSRLPLFRIDHLFTSKGIAVLRCEVRRDRLSMVASDHLPLLAELSC